MSTVGTTGRAGHAPATLLRGALTVGLLIGLFLMHGASPGHDLANLTGQPAAAAGMTGDMTVTPANDMASAAEDSAVRAPAAMTAAGDTDPPAHSPGMGAPCVAVLAGGGLLVLVLQVLRARHAPRSPTGPPAADPAPTRAPPPPPRPPDLAVLCVLRT